MSEDEVQLKVTLILSLGAAGGNQPLVLGLI